MRLAVPGFYALGTSLTPAIVSVATVVLNIVLNLSLVRVLGYPGLALGTAIAALANGGTQLALLRHRLGGLEVSETADCFLRISLASGVMGVAVRVTECWFAALWPGREFPISALTLGVEIVVAIVVLATAARLLGIAEFNNAKEQLLTRLSRILSR